MAEKELKKELYLREVDPKLLKLHPLVHLIPDMRGSEWQGFYTDVAMRGIKVPLEVLADGTVLDGRHRLRAAIELAMKEVPVVDAPLNGDTPEVYMLKAAVLRRHLTDDQRSMMAALWIKKIRDRGRFALTLKNSSRIPISAIVILKPLRRGLEKRSVNETSRCPGKV